MVVTVKVEAAELLAGGVTDVGFRMHVVKFGQPLTVNATKLLKPEREVTVTVELPALPRATVNEVGLAESEKSGDAVPQPVNANDPMRVLQLNAPLFFRYSLMYQKVQSSVGSMRKEL